MDNRKKYINANLSRAEAEEQIKAGSSFVMRYSNNAFLKEPVTDINGNLIANGVQGTWVLTTELFNPITKVREVAHHILQYPLHAENEAIATVFKQLSDEIKRLEMLSQMTEINEGNLAELLQTIGYPFDLTNQKDREYIQGLWNTISTQLGDKIVPENFSTVELSELISEIAVPDHVLKNLMNWSKPDQNKLKKLKEELDTFQRNFLSNQSSNSPEKLVDTKEKSDLTNTSIFSTNHLAQITRYNLPEKFAPFFQMPMASSLRKHMGQYITEGDLSIITGYIQINFTITSVNNDKSWEIQMKARGTRYEVSCCIPKDKISQIYENLLEDYFKIENLKNTISSRCEELINTLIIQHNKGNNDFICEVLNPFIKTNSSSNTLASILKNANFFASYEVDKKLTRISLLIKPSQTSSDTVEFHIPIENANELQVLLESDVIFKLNNN